MKGKRLVQICMGVIIIVLVTIVLFYILQDNDETAVEYYEEYDLNEYVESFSAAYDLDLAKYSEIDLEDFPNYVYGLYDNDSDIDNLLNAFNEAYYNNNFVRKSPSVIIVDNSNETIIILFKTKNSVLVKCTLLKDDNWRNYSIEQIEYDSSSWLLEELCTNILIYKDRRKSLCIYTTIKLKQHITLHLSRGPQVGD